MFFFLPYFDADVVQAPDTFVHVLEDRIHHLLGCVSSRITPFLLLFKQAAADFCSLSPQRGTKKFYKPQGPPPPVFRSIASISLPCTFVTSGNRYHAPPHAACTVQSNTTQSQVECCVLICSNPHTADCLRKASVLHSYRLSRFISGSRVWIVSCETCFNIPLRGVVY